MTQRIALSAVKGPAFGVATLSTQSMAQYWLDGAAMNTQWLANPCLTSVEKLAALAAGFLPMA